MSASLEMQKMGGVWPGGMAESSSHECLLLKQSFFLLGNSESTRKHLICKGRMAKASEHSVAARILGDSTGEYDLRPTGQY
jgi:hypothetical protein